MSGWGKKDDKSSTGTVAISTAGAVTGTSTLFTTEAKVGDFLLEAGGQEFVITAIASNTACTVVAALPGAAITEVTAGTEYTLSEKPKFVTFASTNVDSTDVYGVDATETAVTAGVAQPGWVHRKTIGARVIHETLVALADSSAATMGDAADDTQYPDA